MDPDQPDEKKAEEEARGLLRQTGADVLIWGSVISLSGKSASAMRLFWTPARDVFGAKSTGKYQTETIELPPAFWSNLKQILGALMLFAERRGDAEMAKLAVLQIAAAFTTSRDGCDAHSAAMFEAQLPKARALAEKLAKR